MEAKVIQIQEISRTELTDIIRTSLREELSKLQTNSPEEISNSDSDLLTRKQVLELLNISSVTLWKWQNKRKIIVYGISGKRYFKRSEIMECLTKLK